MTKQQSDFRCGIGYDTHRLVDGRKLLLGGVEIPSPLGLLGHSDGDVLSHAIADALLGAAGLEDIGHYFPDTDPRWKGAGSLAFLETIKGLLSENGFRILNIDSVVVIDEPKLAPYIPQMRETLAGVLGTQSSLVNVKAKTTEGASGTSSASPMAAAHAVVLLAGL